jgi:hypothetical protein
VPLLVNALLENVPDRFQSGQPIFQMLWSDADSFVSPCVNEGVCDTKDFAPLLLFGSVPKDPTVLPTAKAMPNSLFLNCLYNWKFNVKESDCWTERINQKAVWDDLNQTVIYRGSDFNFLPTYDDLPFWRPKHMMHLSDKFKEEGLSPESVVMKLFEHFNEMSPRWRAVVLSARAELHNETWIDAKFVSPIRDETHDKFISLGVNVAASKHIDPYEMSSYKYQLDIGGGGGEFVYDDCTTLSFALE